MDVMDDVKLKTLVGIFLIDQQYTSLIQYDAVELYEQAPDEWQAFVGILAGGNLEEAEQVVTVGLMELRKVIDGFVKLRVE